MYIDLLYNVISKVWFAVWKKNSPPHPPQKNNIANTPWNTNMEPTNHPNRKTSSKPTINIELKMMVFLFDGCILGSTLIFQGCNTCRPSVFFELHVIAIFCGLSKVKSIRQPGESMDFSRKHVVTHRFPSTHLWDDCIFTYMNGWSLW